MSDGDYLVNEALHARVWVSIRRSRAPPAKRDQFPYRRTLDRKPIARMEIEPDKGGIAGYALMLLFEASGKRELCDQGLQNARVLAANSANCDASHSPWPLSGRLSQREGRGPVPATLTYILRLLQRCSRNGLRGILPAARVAMEMDQTPSIPSAAADGALFAQFFEDHDRPPPYRLAR